LYYSLPFNYFTFVMKAARNNQEGLVHAMRSCPALCTELGQQGLACLATCSKCCRDAAIEAVCEEKRGLLASALDTAHSTGLGVHYEAVAWLAVQLLRQEPGTAAGVKEQLLKLPNVPRSLAKQLVSAGMRINYTQLLAAASSMVEGVEVWVQAQQQLSAKSDTPKVAVAICCGENWVSVDARCIWLKMACKMLLTQCGYC
jgi:hypothetical protein